MQTNPVMQISRQSRFHLSDTDFAVTQCFKRLPVGRMACTPPVISIFWNCLTHQTLALSRHVSRLMQKSALLPLVGLLLTPQFRAPPPPLAARMRNSDRRLRGMYWHVPLRTGAVTWNEWRAHGRGFTEGAFQAAHTWCSHAGNLGHCGRIAKSIVRRAFCILLRGRSQPAVCGTTGNVCDRLKWRACGARTAQVVPQTPCVDVFRLMTVPWGQVHGGAAHPEQEVRRRSP